VVENSVGVHLSSKVASTCFYQLRRLRQLRCLLGPEVYAVSVTRRLLSLHNAAARLVLSLNLRDHVKPALKQLHWLTVVYRIRFKLCLLMHHVHFGTAPQYLTDAVQSVTSASPRSGLRSANNAKCQTLY